MLRFILFILSSLFIFTACSKPTNHQTIGVKKNKESHISTRVIYGEDNRKDLYEVESPMLYDFARSTSVLVYSDQLSLVGNHYTTLTETYKESMNLCKSERFGHQFSTGFCSGFLIDDNLLATAGHCVRTELKCEQTAFVFDFATASDSDQGPTQLAKDNVYFCKKLIKSYVNSNGADYAIIELDRAVKGRTPLQIRTDGAIKENEPLVVIGYPSGIPVKVADGANVRRQASGYFEANLDTYGGNSGSAVFNHDTGLVEGILVRGEMDYVYKNGCRISNVCTDDGCRGEDVTHITSVFDSLDKKTRKRLRKK